MKRVIGFSLVVSSMILIGCGGDSNSKDEDSKESVDAVLTKSEAATGVPSGIDFNNKTSLRLKQKRKSSKLFKLNKKIRMIQKEELYSCSETGTTSIDTAAFIMSKSGMLVISKDCLHYNTDTKLYEYNDGTFFTSDDETVAVSTNYTYIPDYVNYPNNGTKSNLTVKMNSSNGIEEIFMDGLEEEYINDILIKKEAYSNLTIKLESNNNMEKIFGNGEMEEYEKGVIDEKIRFNNLLMIENKNKKTWFFEGGFGYESGCFSEYHVYNTKDNDWLVESKENSNEWSSGTLYIDNAEYDYDNLDVTVTKQGKKGTFTQQELLEELERKKKTTDC